MNSMQVKSFLEVAKRLNYTQAAEALFLPQPAVSRYVMSLEKELGVKLFYRGSRRKISLTREGAAYYQLFSEFEKNFREVASSLNASDKKIRFGYSTGWNISSFFPAVLELVGKKDPSIDVVIGAYSNKDLITMLQNDELDLAYMLEYYPQCHSDIETETIRHSRLMITYSERLKGADSIQSPADFKDITFFLTDAPHQNELKQEIYAALEMYGFRPVIKMTPNMDSTLASVENGFGVALFDEHIGNIHSSDIHYALTDYYMPTCIAWKKGNRDHSIDILSSALHDHFGR